MLCQTQKSHKKLFRKFFQLGVKIIKKSLTVRFYQIFIYAKREKIIKLFFNIVDQSDDNNHASFPRTA